MAAAVLTAACASGAGSRGTTPQPAPNPAPYGPTTPPTPPSAAAPPPAPPPAAAIRYGPSALRYVVHRQVHIRQTVSEQVQVQDFGARIYVVVALTGPADSVGYPATFNVDSIAADSGTPAPVADNFGRVRRLVFSGRVTPRGEFVNAVPSDSALAQAAAQLLGNFRDFLPRLPADGLRPGLAWTDTVGITQKGSGGGVEVSRRTIAHATASAWQERNGVRGMWVDATQTYSVAGSGTNAGQPFDLSGTGTGNGSGFIAADGRYLGGESRDSTTLTIHLPVQGVAVPVIQVTRTTVTVLP